jgi:Kelch motif
MLRLHLPAPLLVALISGATAATTHAHFLWITIERPPQDPRLPATIRTFLEEEPMPGSERFLEHIAGVELRADSHSLPLMTVDGVYEALWAGKLPATIDAVRDMGVSTRKGVTYRLLYSARAQNGVAAAASAEDAGLRTRMVDRDGRAVLRVTFDGQPVPNARIRVYPHDADEYETNTDASGHADLADLAAGNAAVWATHIDATAGMSGDQAFSETRHYATLTFSPAPQEESTTYFATLPAPAVNSFGGATLGDWLYVYSGHLGKMHDYHSGTTAKHFRRLDLRDGTTWEDLPMSADLQGVALVSDDRALYRIGGMKAHNEPDGDEDTRSVADFARFDPVTMAWADLPPLPEPRSTHDAIVFENTIYVFGGWNLKGSDAKPEYANTALAFDLARPESGWRSFEQPFRRRALAVAEQDGKLFVLGGLQSDSKVTTRVDVFDPRTQVWSRGPDLPGRDEHEGFSPSAFTVADRLYYSGMAGEIFRLADGAARFEIVGAWFEPRLTHRLLPGPGSSLLAVGGNHRRGKQTARIERILVNAAAKDTPPQH